MKNFTINSIERDGGYINVQYTYQKSYNGGTDADGNVVGVVSRDFEANRSYIDGGEIDEEIEASIKKEFGIE